MKKRVLASVMAIVLGITGCGLGGNVTETPSAEQSVEKEVTQEVENKEEAPAKVEEKTSDDVCVVKTSLLGDVEEKYYDESLVPQIAPYSVKEDFSNVVIADQFKDYFIYNPERDYYHAKEVGEALVKNNFVVTLNGADEFFDVYEDNRYVMFPSFITVDSLMHTYHLYFAHLMKTCEKEYLFEKLKVLSSQMLSESEAQYEALKDTEWYNAAVRNVAFFYIGSKLLGEDVAMPVAIADDEALITKEIDKINAAEVIDECALTGLNEDYSQYKVRGYYEGDEQLEKYFRAMMWYGRISYKLEIDDMVKSAVLQAMAISKNPREWEGIYNVTSFFAGKSDDPGYADIADIVNIAYGKMPETTDLSDEAAFNAVMEAMKKLNPPAINSIPVFVGEETVIPSYRFMGQRFTVDAAVMQTLVYDAVEENSNGDYRYLPDALDTAAALGSEAAMKILTEQGDTDYKNYTDNLTIVSDHFNNDDPKIWNASLYAGWLNTLRPLFEKKGEGYPSYMLNVEWEKKNLETYAGSYAELKHDTILYAKQVMAEMGGGDEDPVDDRGYVDPQPVIYSRFKFLSEKTKEGLEGYGMITDSAKEDLDKLSEIAGTLLTISEKELKNEALTEDEYEFIRCYGGYLEHFWLETNKDSYDGDLVYSYQAPCPIIADIATDPNGSVLEVGTGLARQMYVVFPIDGELHIGRGSVYSFYQFTQPINDRLTDSEWRAKLSGGYLDDDYNWVEVEDRPVQPEWTQSYRIKK